MAKFSLSNSPGHLLRRAQQYAYDLYTKEVGSSGPTPRQFAVLHTVKENEGLSQTDLVRRTGIDRSTLADMISRLIKKGWLTRQRTKADARANAVSISAAGSRVLAAALPKVQKAEAATVALLSPSQRAAFTNSLKAFADALDKMEEAAAKPARKKRATKKKATKKKAAKKKATKKKATKKKATKKKAVGRKKAVKRKTAAKKKAPARKKAVKRKTTAKKARKAPARRKTAKRGRKK
ncbi:MAG: hypothetical protein Tsb0010_07190 [Parvularculaceae bacterium]